MSNKVKRNRRRNGFRKDFPRKFVCPNCKKTIAEGHFIPASLGEEGFYTCKREVSR